MGKPIYFRLYGPAGLINQTMSLEIAAGIHYKTSRKIIVHDTLCFNAKTIPSPSRYFERYPNMVSSNNTVSINDILDWDGKENFIFLEKYMPPSNESSNVINVQENFLVDDINEIPNSDFADERNFFSISEDSVLYLEQTLNWYSRFFYNRDNKFDKRLSTVRFSQEYYDLAERIAKDIGTFTGIHLRMTDHATQMYRVTKEDIHDQFSRIKHVYPIVMSTDNPDDPVLDSYRSNILFLDKIIYDNYLNDFLKLPFHNDVIFGLICNLVMHYSYDFIGTQGSTFSGYIQRNRMLNKMPQSWKMFGSPEYDIIGEYSWNGYPINTLGKSWWREWGEAKLDV